MIGLPKVQARAMHHAWSTLAKLAESNYEGKELWDTNGMNNN